MSTFHALVHSETTVPSWKHGIRVWADFLCVHLISNWPHGLIPTAELGMLTQSSAPCLSPCLCSCPIFHRARDLWSAIPFAYFILPSLSQSEGKMWLSGLRNVPQSDGHVVQGISLLFFWLLGFNGASSRWTWRSSHRVRRGAVVTPPFMEVLCPFKVGEVESVNFYKVAAVAAACALICKSAGTRKVEQVCNVAECCVFKSRIKQLLKINCRASFIRKSCELGMLGVRLAHLTHTWGLELAGEAHVILITRMHLPG